MSYGFSDIQQSKGSFFFSTAGHNWMKCSRADRHVRMRRFSDVAGSDSIPIFRVLLMGTESVPERSENLQILKRVSARIHFIGFCRREIFKIYRIFIFGQRQPNVQWRSFVSTKKQFSIHTADKTLHLHYEIIWEAKCWVSKSEQLFLSNKLFIAKRSVLWFIQLYTLTACVPNNNGKRVLNCEGHRKERSWPSDVCIERLRKTTEPLDS